MGGGGRIWGDKKRVGGSWLGSKVARMVVVILGDIRKIVNRIKKLYIQACSI